MRNSRVEAARATKASKNTKAFIVTAKLTKQTESRAERASGFKGNFYLIRLELYWPLCRRNLNAETFVEL